MDNVFPPDDLTIEPLIVIRPRRTSLAQPKNVAHPFDLFQIRRGLCPKSLDAHLAPFPLTLPDIGEPTGGVRDGVHQSHLEQVVGLWEDAMSG